MQRDQQRVIRIQQRLPLGSIESAVLHRLNYNHFIERNFVRTLLLVKYQSVHFKQRGCALYNPASQRCPKHIPLQRYARTSLTLTKHV